MDSEEFGIYDYRTVLRDTLKLRQQKNNAYSLRSFARDLEVPPSRLCEILQGKAGISQVTSAKMAKNLKLPPTEKQIFIWSAVAQHSKSKKKQQQARAKFKKTIAERHLWGHDAIDQLEIVRTWYHLAILEVLMLKKPPGDSKAIAKKLGIKTQEARLALQKLKNLGFVEKTKTGYQVQKSRNIFAGRAPSTAIRAHHRQILQKAEAAIDDQDLDQRLLTATTIRTNKAQLKEAEALTAEFHERLARILAAPIEEADAIYCCSTQIFELTQTR